MQVINQDNNKTMRSGVQKAHHQHRHRHHHSKNKRRHTDVVETSNDEASPVISVRSDTTASAASDTYFPLTKENCDTSDSESLENSAVRKRQHRYSDEGDVNERTGFNSDCSDDAHQDEHVKRRKKHKHKEKKKRKHSKKDKGESDTVLDRCRFLELREKQECDRQCDSSPIRQQQEHVIVRVKQEPLSSDEDTMRRRRNAERRQKNGSDRNGHSISVTTSTSRRLKPDRPVKLEPCDHSSSHERNSRADFRRDIAERRNGSNNEHRDRRNGRVNGETSSVNNERHHSSRSIERDRRRGQRSNDRAGHSREHRNDSKLGIRQIKKPRPSDDEAEYEWGKPGNKQSQVANNRPGTSSAAADQKKPNFGLSGKLTEDVNVYNGVVIKYSEPPEARKPKRRWRFYPFKGDETLPTLYIHRQSAYLIGRDRKVADIPVDHPSCSKQHAALQYRLVPFTREDGSKGKRVRPYIIDLESANGTFVNNKKIEPRKYVELMERDVIKFGYSSRDYVLLHEHSKGDEDDDDDDDQNG